MSTKRKAASKEDKKWVDDEAQKHPFYSDWGIRQWKKRLKEIEKEEASWSKRKSHSQSVESIQDTGPSENPE